MNEKNLYELLLTLNIPVAYDHFIEADRRTVSPPFILYRNDASDQFKADDQIYIKTRRYLVDLVTDIKNAELEEALEEIFQSNHIPWDKTEVYIDSERIFQITYSI